MLRNILRSIIVGIVGGTIGGVVVAGAFACGQHWQVEINPTTGWLNDVELRKLKDVGDDGPLPTNINAALISLVDEVEICRVMVGYTGDEGLTIGDFDRTQSDE